MRMKDFPLKSKNCLFIVEAKQMKVQFIAQYGNLFPDFFFFFCSKYLTL